MLSIFSCVCWRSICFLWRNVCLSFLSIFWLGCLFSDIELHELLIHFKAIPLLGIYTKNTTQIDTCTPVFIAALFTIAIWKQPRCPSTDKEVVEHIYNGMLCSHKKDQSWVIWTEVWMKLEPVTQSEVHQKEKSKYCKLMHVYGIQKNGTGELISWAGIETQT